MSDIPDDKLESFDERTLQAVLRAIGQGTRQNTTFFVYIIYYIV